MKKNCEIANNEPLLGKGMQNFLAAYTDVQIMASCANAQELQTVLQQEQIDIVFLDINMPYLNVVEFMQTQMDRNFGVIITTTYSQHAAKDFDLNAIDYLLKPIEEDPFLRALQKAEEYLQQKKMNCQDGPHIFIKCDKVIEKLWIEDINYIEAMRNYVMFHTNKKRYIHYSSFKNIDTKMSEFGFLKVQKSFIVNPTKITRYDSNYLYIQDVKIPISRDAKLAILKQIKELMGATI
jgi:hypothetical protein